MPIRLLRWLRRHPLRGALALLLLAFVALNVLAFRHAFSMTHFVEDGTSLVKPESMSPLQKVRALTCGVRIPKPRNHATPEDLGMDFEMHRFASSDGVVCEGWFVPGEASQPLCILFHGYSESKSRLLNEALAFQEFGLNVLLVDFRGCGGSSGFETTIGYGEADDVRAAVDFALTTLHYDDVILYGRSMGSAAILRAVSCFRMGPRAVILESPFDRLLSTIKNRFDAMGVPSFPASELLVFWGGVQQGYSGFSHNPADYASQVDCPALVLHGARDRRATLAQATTVFEKLAGRKQFAMFENAGHEACLNADAKRWKQSVGSFLRSLSHRPLVPG